MIPEAEKRRVADAVRAAEAKTTGEIYCVVAQAASRYATIVADEGIHQKVAPETWNGAIDILIAAIKDGHPADGFVGAVERCGAVLAEHFPRPAGSVAPNDLPDKLVEI
jgi:putative membrane protein